MKKSVFLLLVFVVLSNIPAYAESSDIILSPGGNIIALSVANEWKKDLANLSVSVGMADIPDGLDINVTPSMLSIRNDKSLKKKIFLEITVNDETATEAFDIPVIFSDSFGNSWEHVIPVSITSEVPTQNSLAQNFPNPFNPTTTIQFSLADKSNVRLYVYNSLGQLVTTLLHETRSPGMHSVVWDGKDENGLKVSSGIYFYHMETETFSNTKRMMIIE